MNSDRMWWHHTHGRQLTVKPNSWLYERMCRILRPNVDWLSIQDHSNIYTQTTWSSRKWISWHTTWKLLIGLVSAGKWRPLVGSILAGEMKSSYWLSRQEMDSLEGSRIWNHSDQEGHFGREDFALLFACFDSRQKQGFQWVKKIGKFF